MEATDAQIILKSRSPQCDSLRRKPKMKTSKNLLWSLLLLLALAVSVAGQQSSSSTPGMPVNDPGNASISGRVMMPSGLIASENIKIILGNGEVPLVTL